MPSVLPKTIQKTTNNYGSKPGKSKSEVTSYRPFRLISCLGKVWVKMITNTIKDWCNKNNIIDK